MRNNKQIASAASKIIYFIGYIALAPYSGNILGYIIICFVFTGFIGSAIIELLYITIKEILDSLPNNKRSLKDKLEIYINQSLDTYGYVNFETFTMLEENTNSKELDKLISKFITEIPLYEDYQNNKTVYTKHCLSN